MSRALRRRYGHAKVTPAQREALLKQAVFDWASGRAYIKKGRYWLRPVIVVAGMRTIGDRSDGRATVAPWNKVAHEEWGDSSDKLHDAANKMYPREMRGGLLDRGPA